MPGKRKIKTSGIRLLERGGPDLLFYQSFLIDEPGEGEALVRVCIAGVNFADVYQRSGRSRYLLPLPCTLGIEGAGVIERVGPGITNVIPGDRVAFIVSNGAYAEAIVVPARRLIKLPDRLSFQQGVAFPLQGMTAHYLMKDYYQIKKGDVVLVHAAAGGMGLLLVQWAKRLGALAIGTVSTEQKAALAQSVGADHTIIYSKHDFVQEVKTITGGIGVDYIVTELEKIRSSKTLTS